MPDLKEWQLNFYRTKMSVVVIKSHARQTQATKDALGQSNSGLQRIREKSSGVGIPFRILSSMTLSKYLWLFARLAGQYISAD